MRSAREALTASTVLRNGSPTLSSLQLCARCESRGPRRSAACLDQVRKDATEESAMGASPGGGGGAVATHVGSVTVAFCCRARRRYHCGQRKRRTIRSQAYPRAVRVPLACPRLNLGLVVGARKREGGRGFYLCGPESVARPPARRKRLALRGKRATSGTPPRARAGVRCFGGLHLSLPL